MVDFKNVFEYQWSNLCAQVRAKKVESMKSLNFVAGVVGKKKVSCYSVSNQLLLGK